MVQFQWLLFFYFIIVVVQLRLGSTGLDEQDITVLDDVFLALGHDLSLGLNFGFIAQLLQNVEVIDNGLDKGLLKVTVNDTGGLRSLGSVTDRPLADFIGTGCEEAAQLKGLAHLKDDLGEDRLSADGLLLLLDLLLGHAREALLEGNGDGNDGVTLGVLLDPLNNLGQVLVLLSDEVLLRQVDQEDDRLGCEEEERVDDLDLFHRLLALCFQARREIE